MALQSNRQIVSAVSAPRSFTTLIPQFINNDNGAIQVIWTNLTHANATFKLKATLDGTNFSDLLSTFVTLVSGSSSALYNFTDAGYATVQAVYDAGSNTTGTIDVWVCTKARQ